MSAKRSFPVFWAAVGVVVVLGVAAAFYPGKGSGPTAQASTIRMPALSPQAVAGKAAFDAVCAQCHGTNALGSDHGPPLLHEIYNPGHHGDVAFLMAVRNGSRQHHWRFGDMPAQPTVSDQQVRDIVRYVRELQGANGIRAQQHSM